MVTTLRLPRADGTAWTVTVHEAGPSSPVVLVVPAMGVGARWYRPLLAALAGAGCTAAVTELRGHEETVEGESAPPPAGRRRDHGYADLVEDLGRATVALTEHAGSPAYLLGHSLGGQVASAYAATAPATGPGAPAGLMLVASGTPYWRAWGRASWRILALTQAVGLGSRVLGSFPGARLGFGGREAPTQMRDWARLARTGRIVLDDPRRDLGDDLAALALPVLALSLAGDDLAPRRSLEGLLDLLPGCDVDRRHLDPVAMGEAPTDHLRWARTPDLVVAVVLDWLRQRPAGPRET